MGVSDVCGYMLGKNYTIEILLSHTVAAALRAHVVVLTVIYVLFSPFDRRNHVWIIPACRARLRAAHSLFAYQSNSMNEAEICHFSLTVKRRRAQQRELLMIWKAWHLSQLVTFWYVNFAVHALELTFWWSFSLLEVCCKLCVSWQHFVGV